MFSLKQIFGIKSGGLKPFNRRKFERLIEKKNVAAALALIEPGRDSTLRLQKGAQPV